MDKQIRVFVVDDHPFFRRGVVEWVMQQPELIFCGEADSVASTRARIKDGKPQVLLLDLRLKDGDGLDLTLELSENFPEMRIVVLSQCEEDVYAHRALRAGARGYVMKSEATENVLTAIRTVVRGEVYVSRLVAARAFQNLFPDPASTQPELAKLSDRELQVFQLIGAGCSNREVSATLKISTKTVETYRENLKQKLALRDAPALVKAAKRWVEEGRYESA